MHAQLHQQIARHFMPAPRITHHTKPPKHEDRVIERANELLAQQNLNAPDLIDEAMSECQDFTALAPLMTAGNATAAHAWITKTVRDYWFAYYLTEAQNEIDSADASACTRCNDAGCPSCERDY